MQEPEDETVCPAFLIVMTMEKAMLTCAVVGFGDGAATGAGMGLVVGVKLDHGVMYFVT